MLSRRELFGAAAAAGLASAQQKQPNFVLMMADDLGYADLGCTGSEYVKTPHLDALAKSGSRFTNWYSNAPVCAPSRSALLTGKYPQRAGVATNGRELAQTHKTIASVLKPRGYATALTGKWHLGYGPETVPNAHGFDEFFGFQSGCVDYFSHRYYWGEPRRVNYHDLWRNRTEIFEDGQYLTELLAREAVSFIERQHSRPFFLYLPFNAAHYPMHAPQKYTDRFRGLPLERQVHAAMIAAADDVVGKVVATIEKHGLRENTFMLFTADNGMTREPRAGLNQNPPEAGSNKPFRGFKFSLFDGGMHVPMIMSWPGTIPAGVVNAAVGAHMDIMPTICAAAGAPPPDGIDGKSVLPVASKRAASPHDFVFWENGRQRAVRHGNWKLVLNGILYDGHNRTPLEGDDAVFLSNLENDPGESKNVAKANPELVERLKAAIEEWARGNPARGGA
ncbi:MAG: sulfatase-like hydrolase/transferase [Acidobacteria bacterium]|nr:sulfatase-like hydrolase/transferase [Acidobacteriota bacterium]